MILVDANLLVYAHVGSMAQHDGARTWLDGRLNGSAAVGLPWPSLLGFVRLVSNARVFERAEPARVAWRQAEAWLACPVVWVPQPTDRHREILAGILDRGGVGGHLVPDAHLAALAIEHGLELCSADGDFARFEGLRWSNPIGQDR